MEFDRLVILYLYPNNSLGAFLIIKYLCKRIAIQTMSNIKYKISMTESKLTQPTASTMAMVVLPLNAWENMTATINEVKDLLTEKTATEMNHKWVESTTARKMLGVSPKTWQTYRDKRIIPFSQIGRKIFVRRTDLDNFMESHYIRKEVK